jgi:hypothetical protein
MKVLLIVTDIDRVANSFMVYKKRLKIVCRETNL